MGPSEREDAARQSIRVAAVPSLSSPPTPPPPPRRNGSSNAAWPPPADRVSSPPLRADHQSSSRVRRPASAAHLYTSAKFSPNPLPRHRSRWSPGVVDVVFVVAKPYKNKYTCIYRVFQAHSTNAKSRRIKTLCSSMLLDTDQIIGFKIL